MTCKETANRTALVNKFRAIEPHFRTFAQGAAVGMVVLTGPDHEVHIVNDAYAQLVGRQREELLGQRLFDVIPEGRSHFHPYLEKVRVGGEPLFLYEYPYNVGTNGERKQGFLSLVYQPFREREQVVGVMVLCQEVTAQVAERRKGRESERNLELAVEIGELGVYSFDLATRIGTYSPLLMKWFGLATAELPLSEVLFRIHPDDRQSVISRIEQSMQDTTSTKYDQTYRLVNPLSGQVRYVRSMSRVVIDDGVPIFLNGIVQDVTSEMLSKKELEESENNLRNMILQAPVAICILKGPRFVIDIANNAMLELWNKTAEEAQGKGMFEVLPETREQGYEEALNAVLHTGKQIHSKEVPFAPLKNGIPVPVLIDFSLEPLRNADGRVYGVLGMAIEVTDQVNARRKIEQLVAERTSALEQSNERLQRSNADLEQFAYIASHDLQEPLRKVMLFIEMLRSSLQQGSREDAEKYFEKIEYSAARMQALIRDVLAYSQLSKPQGGHVQTDLNGIIEDMLSDYELLVSQTGACVDSQALPTIEAIPLQMTQLFSNLLSNALKFVHAGRQPLITIRARPVPEQELQSTQANHHLPYWEISFHDNGIGFGQEHASKIFLIFQRLHGANEYAGTGIGLALCKKIAQNHHGDIRAFSEPGSGTTFTIMLPGTQPVASRTH